MKVEEQKKRAEADKLAALTALEKRSREFLREKEEKRQLEAKIQVWTDLGQDLCNLTGSVHSAHPTIGGTQLTSLFHAPCFQQSMQSQMLVGGAKLEDVPAFRAILAREHRRIRGEGGQRLRQRAIDHIVPV